MVHRSLIFLTIAFIQSDKGEENNNLIPSLPKEKSDFKVRKKCQKIQTKGDQFLEIKVLETQTRIH
jgi:hypothetical protein